MFGIFLCSRRKNKIIKSLKCIFISFQLGINRPAEGCHLPGEDPSTILFRKAVNKRMCSAWLFFFSRKPGMLCKYPCNKYL